MPTVIEPTRRTLSELGLDEAWLEGWLQQDPRRLGLGAAVRIVRAQLSRPAGSSSRGRLDLQAVDDTIEDRVYDIELMRGELDADHGFRALDYWARERRADDQDRDHLPVIVAERVKGTRYWTLLETLAEHMSLIVLEVRSMEVDGRSAVWLEQVLVPEDLQPGEAGDLKRARGNLTEEEWRARTTADFWTFLDSVRTRFAEWGLTHTPVWSAKSYVGLWKGSRCWCPIWPRKQAAGRIYLPAPKSWGEVAEGELSTAFDAAKAELAKEGVELVWSWSYNAGFNPLALTLEAQHLESPTVRRFLEETWRALD